MPKMKTRRGTAKRMRVSKSGKIRFKKAMGRHILTMKSPKNKRRIGTPGFLSTGDKKRAMKVLPYLQKGV
jgi:large subunit ribosomal protein L35